MQPKKLKDLDGLLAQAEHFASYSMRNIGRVPPTLFLIGQKGLIIFTPESLAGEGDKDDFATTIRLICIAHAATASVLALEAWVKSAKPGEKLDATERPSEAADRQEVVVLMGESLTGQRQKLLPIIRSDNGNFFGFGESDLSGIDDIKGRFAQLLPTKLPPKGIQEVAKAMLKAKGVAASKLGSTPRLPRARRRRG